MSVGGGAAALTGATGGEGLSPVEFSSVELEGSADEAVGADSSCE